MDNETLKLGGGAYTAPEVARILGIDPKRVDYWVRAYLKGRFKAEQGFQYHTQIGSQAVLNFHSLIETYSFFAFKKAKVPVNDIIEAHRVLSERYKTHYPFAHADLFLTAGEILAREGTGKNANIFRAKDSLQLYLGFITPFAEKLRFDKDRLADAFYPLGRDKTVIIDPNHQFGQPTIKGTNILASTIFQLNEAGDSKSLIQNLYDLTDQQVNDAIHYFRRAA